MSDEEDNGSPPLHESGGHALEKTGWVGEAAATPPPPPPPKAHDLESTGYASEVQAPADFEPTLDIDSVLDERYRIEEKLGQGGMGTVYRVTDLTLRRPFAIKVLNQALQNNPTAMDALAREVSTGLELQHANLLRIHALEIRSLPYVRMDFVDGGDLDIALRRAGGRLEDNVVRDLMGQLLDALDYLHGKGFIHRDIKPQNVMLTREGNVKLADYGIASALGAADGDITGTPLYMAPEAIRGQPIDLRSDIYAVGMMMYLLLTGRFPFGTLHSATVESVRAWHLGNERTLTGLKDEWLNPLSKALAPDPSDRFRTCADFKDAISATSTPPARAPDGNVSSAVETLPESAGMGTGSEDPGAAQPADAAASSLVGSSHSEPASGLVELPLQTQLSSARRTSKGLIAAGVVGLGLLALAGSYLVSDVSDVIEPRVNSSKPSQEPASAPGLTNAAAPSKKTATDVNTSTQLEAERLKAAEEARQRSERQRLEAERRRVDAERERLKAEKAAHEQSVALRQAQNELEAQRQVKKHRQVGTHEVFNTYKDPKGETWLTLRSKPSNKGRVVGELIDGTRLDVTRRNIGRTKFWMEVRVKSGPFRGKKGYVGRKWVRPVGAP